MSQIRTNFSKNKKLLDEGFNKLTKEADVSGALVAFQAITQSTLTNLERFEVLHGIARCQKLLKQYESAIATLQTALKIKGPKKLRVYHTLASIYLSLDDFIKAEEVFALTKDCNPDDPFFSQYIRLKIVFLRQAGRHEEALKLIDSHPNIASLRIMKIEMLIANQDEKNAYHLLSKEENSEVKNPVSLLVQLLERHRLILRIQNEKLRQPLLAKLRKDIERISAVFPKYTKMQLAHARIEEEFKAPETANRIYKKIENDFPDFWEAWHSHAVFLHKQGNFKESIPLLERITKASKFVLVKPTTLQFAEAHHSLGVAYFEMGDKKLSEQEANLAIKLNPNHAAAHSTLGKIHAGTNDKVSRFHFDKSKELNEKRWEKNHPYAGSTGMHRQHDNDLVPHAPADTKKPMRHVKEALKPALTLSASYSHKVSTSSEHNKEVKQLSVPQPAALEFKNSFDALAKDARKQDKKCRISMHADEEKTPSVTAVAPIKVAKVKMNVEHLHEAKRTTPCELLGKYYADATHLLNRGYGFFAKRVTNASKKISENAEHYLAQLSQTSNYYIKRFGLAVPHPTAERIRREQDKNGNQSAGEKIKRKFK